MRTVTKEYTVYDYNDLLANKELKERVLKENWDINVTFDWWDWIIESWIEENEENGIEFIRKSIEFDLYRYKGCKCDYEVDIDKALLNIDILTEKEKRRIKQLIYNGVCDYDSYITDQHPLVKKMMNKLYKAIERMEGLARNELYDRLWKEYDYLTSEESILETIQANEYEFLEDGTIA